MKEKRQDFLIYLAVGAVIAAAVFALNMSRAYPVTRCVCDGLFVASAMLLCLGGIKAVRNTGAFDVMGYGAKTTVETFLPFLKRSDEKEDIHQYKERKAAERRGSATMLLAGAAYLAASLIALAVYYAAE